MARYTADLEHTCNAACQLATSTQDKFPVTHHRLDAARQGFTRCARDLQRFGDLRQGKIWMLFEHVQDGRTRRDGDPGDVRLLNARIGTELWARRFWRRPCFIVFQFWL